MSIDVYRERREHLANLQARAAGYTNWKRLPHQYPPEGEWTRWLLEGGRGSGKSVTAVGWMRDHLNGPPCLKSTKTPHRMALIAPTLGDAIESAELNELSLVNSQPGAKLTQVKGSMVLWPNGSQIRLFGCHTKEDYQRLRAGGNRCGIWAEELAAWRYLTESWKQMLLGLRLGPRPQVVASTTPAPRPEYIAIRDQFEHHTNATTRDNPYLNEEQRDLLYELYGGTSVGKQELEGQLIKEAEGALWTYALIEKDRLTMVENVGRIVVAVDPPGGATEAGIVAAGLLPQCQCRSDGRLPHVAVLQDASGKLTPEGWGSRAVGVYHDTKADRVVAEKNFGGDMVEAIISGIDPTVPYKDVSASRGKRQRAEPIKALYEQGRVHHVGTFPELEAEMVQWVQDESSWSPNRLDALVWAVTELAGGNEPSIWFA